MVTRIFRVRYMICLQACFDGFAAAYNAFGLNISEWLVLVLCQPDCKSSTELMSEQIQREPKADSFKGHQWRQSLTQLTFFWNLSDLSSLVRI